MLLLSALRRRIVAMKDWAEGKLHPRRRVQARRRLEALRPTSVLFVCLGNVCRSPYGERVLKLRAGEALEVRSAGFIGPGRPAPDTALAVARARGIEHGDHRSRLLTHELAASAEVVLFFDQGNRRRLRSVPGVRPGRTFWLGDFDPHWSGKRAIPDPWGKSAVDFQRTFERIERCVDEVWAVVEGRVSP